MLALHSASFEANQFSKFMTSNDIKKQMSRQEDYEVIRNVLNGSVQLFDVLQNKYRYLIYSLIHKMVRDEDDVQDLVQETFIKAYKSLNSFSFDYAFSSWLYKIASNSCIDFIRKKRNIVYLSQMNPDPESNEDYEIPDDSYLPDKNIINKERFEIIKNAIDSLPDKYKAIIKLRHDEDLDYTEIADKLNMPLGTVKVNLFRARKILELQLRKYPDVFDLVNKMHPVPND
ncbi:MAG: sigma-70 family RNA polymerase sigma factor [Ignavibacteria bacterium]|jgi:RNA polymerase sigma-70 factor (ECF subfamily)|nr:sigma-70 family RNA polymerase sigma factor [Ignavibacteria bacterium]